MKPPQTTNRGRGGLLLLVIGLVLFAGCRQSADKPSPPPPEKPSDAAIDSTGPTTEGPTLEAPMNQPAPAEPAQPEQPAATSPEPPVEEPAAATPPEAPPAEPSPSPTEQPAPAESNPSPPSDTPSTETPPADTPSTKPSEPEASPAAPATLGPPLGEDVAKLTPLQPKPTVWIDKQAHRVIAVGQVCQRNAPLEMFACPSGTKEHEAIVAIPHEPVPAIPTVSRVIHAALLAVGAEPGKPVQFYPKYAPATGTEVAIDVRWKDEQGKVHTAKAQDWIRNIATKKPMEHNWVFGGSSFWKDEQTGQEHYSADSGDLICVSNFPSATLDLPIESSQSDASLVFEAFTENIPPLGTPVTIILKPILDKKPAKEPAKATEEKPEQEKTEDSP